MALPSLLPRTRPPVRAVIACVAVLALIGGAWLWLRDSSLVAVDNVTVTGVSGSEAPQVRAALEDAARDMTTLHVRDGQLKTAVAPYPAVRAVEAHADFPHGLKIVVHEHVAVGVLNRVPIAADGTILRGTTTSGLPVIAVRANPGGDELRDRDAQRAVRLLAAAPAPLRARATKVYLSSRGLTARLHNGPVLYFGGSERLAAKWAAATAVLADKSSAGATYLDLRLPESPAAGGLVAPEASQPDPSTTTTPPSASP